MKQTDKVFLPDLRLGCKRCGQTSFVYPENLRIGIHTSTAGSLEKAAVKAKELGARILYRAVQSSELNRIQESGKYDLQQGMSEVKGFFASPEEASTFAQRFYASMGGEGGPFTLTSGAFPNSVIPESINVAGEGTAYFLPGSSLSSAASVSMYDFFPLSQ